MELGDPPACHLLSDYAYTFSPGNFHDVFAENTRMRVCVCAYTTTDTRMQNTRNPVCLHSPPLLRALPLLGEGMPYKPTARTTQHINR